MTKFADELFDDLMREHGPALAQARPPAAPRRRVVARPLWLGTGAAGLAAGVAASVLVLGGSPAYAAYTVTPQANGAVTISVYRAAGVAGANAALHRLGARVVVVPVRPGCVPFSSLPHPAPGTHLRGVSTKAGLGANGHRSVSVRIKGGIPAGTTMVLAFSGQPRGGGSLGAGGLITGQVPRCVSLPAPPGGRSGSVTGSGGGQGSATPTG
jgi:hypothetical protein